MEVTEPPTNEVQTCLEANCPSFATSETEVAPSFERVMVRTYKPKNPFYRNSKLSDFQLFIVLYACLTFMPNAKIASDAGVSEKTLKAVFRKYAEKLASSYSVRRYHLETLLAKGYINEGLFDHLANNLFQKSDDFWIGFEDCVFRCPKMLSFKANEKELTSFLEKHDPGSKTPRLDAQNALFVHWYARNTIATKRVPCVGCRFLNASKIEPLYRNAFYTFIGEFFQSRRLQRNNLKTFFLPSLFSFLIYAHSLREAGITYPYDYKKGLPKFETSDQFVHAVFPTILKAAAEFMNDAIDSLESDPL